ncbi:MAG: cytochrome c biogenesis protein CcdA [Burkholderiales bacterium]|nr:cytochrome c biogenesis protein CcdA [Burkholderiales bacterium]
MINPLFAVLAGVLTVAAPCVLPMLPVVLGASVGQHDRSRPIFIALGFAFAFCAVAILFSTFSHVLGLSQDALRDFAAVMLLLFGVLMIWRTPFDWLAVRMNGVLNRVNAVGDRAGGGKLGGLVLGMTLGALWTPCAGPVLGSILTLVATTPDIAQAGFLLACYSLGAALPMMAIAYGGQMVTLKVRQLAGRMHRVQQVFGVVVMLTAAAMFFNYDTAATLWLSGAFA